MLIQTEDTRDPATMTFLPGRAVLETGTLEFGDGESAARSPLAKRLFEIPSVARVVLGPDFVRVSKTGEADWPSLKGEVLRVIIQQFISGEPVLDESLSEAAEGAGDTIEFESESNEIVIQIKELIETRLRPAALQTGGDVTFHGYRDGVVYLDMTGGAASLRDGIVNVLRHYIPDVVEVRDFRDAIAKPGLDTPEGAAVQRALDERINPSVAAHGGHIALVDVLEDTVYIRLEGGCQGCGMADVTLKQGIEREIRSAVPSIVAVLDTTDHAGGTNPYYQPGKGGASPV